MIDVRALQAAGLYPCDARIAQGPVAVFECAQAIPCNPCEKACPHGYIEIGTDITCIPRVDDRCNGCGRCLAACPGLCIFILDGAYSETEATVTMPYELLPVPQPGDVLQGLDRTGTVVCDAVVIRLGRPEPRTACCALTVAVPKRFVHDVRHVRRQGGPGK